MGLGAAQFLLRAGIEVVGCDVESESLGRFETSGGAAVSSSARAAQGIGAVVVMVVDVAQTEEVLFGTDGVQAGLNWDTVII